MFRLCTNPVYVILYVQTLCTACIWYSMCSDFVHTLYIVSYMFRLCAYPVLFTAKILPIIPTFCKFYVFLNIIEYCVVVGFR